MQKFDGYWMGYIMFDMFVAHRWHILLHIIGSDNEKYLIASIKCNSMQTCVIHALMIASLMN